MVIQSLSDELLVIQSLSVHRHHQISEALVPHPSYEQRFVLATETKGNAVGRYGSETIGDVAVIKIALEILALERCGKRSGAFAEFSAFSGKLEDLLFGLEMQAELIESVGEEHRKLEG